MDCHKLSSVHIYRNGGASFLNRMSIKDFPNGFTLCSFSLSLEQNLSTPLHLAALGGHNETCVVLVGKAAEANARNVVRNKYCLPYAM